MNQSLIPSSCPPESDQPAFVQNTARILVLMQIKIQGGEGGDSVSSVATVREAQARQRAASRNDRRRCLNCCTVGAHRAPLQLGNPAIFKLSHYPGAWRFGRAQGFLLESFECLIKRRK